jgi:hypothetical protein
MNKKIKQSEIKQVMAWITDSTTYAEMCRQMKVNPRTPSGYVRIAVILRHLFQSGIITTDTSEGVVTTKK